MNKEILQVAIIQSELDWEQPDLNLKRFGRWLAQLEEETDLVMLPEMFTTGFSMNASRLAEPMGGPAVAWMQAMAKSHDVAICGSLIIEESGKFYNRLLFVRPDGSYQSYDKRHTFTLAGEHKVFTSGEQRLIVEYKGWKICPLICYDLRFPVWARNNENYDLLIYTANWPNKRMAAWDALLKARAIENMSYCIGVNRVGLDGNGHLYTGHSAAYDALGNKISKNLDEAAWIETVMLSKSQLREVQNRLQFLEDQDSFSLS